MGGMPFFMGNDALWRKLA